MNLSDWSSLSESQQHELIVKWYKTGKSHDYLDMAEEASKVLKGELKFNVDVTNVRVGTGVNIHVEVPATRIDELILHVCTLLPEHQTIEGLCGRFCGFHVVQLNLGDRRNSFLKTLTCMMAELKGWTESDTLKWADERPVEPLNDSLSGGFLFVRVYDQGPVKLALSAIIDELKTKSSNVVGSDYIDLRNSMLSVMWDATREAGSLEFYHPDTVQKFDWGSVKIKINNLIEREGRRS
jgi:hypothetical protein